MSRSRAIFAAVRKTLFLSAWTLPPSPLSVLSSELFPSAARQGFFFSEFGDRTSFLSVHTVGLTGIGSFFLFFDSSFPPLLSHVLKFFSRLSHARLSPFHCFPGRSECRGSSSLFPPFCCNPLFSEMGLTTTTSVFSPR